MSPGSGVVTTYLRQSGTLESLEKLGWEHRSPMSDQVEHEDVTARCLAFT